MQTKCPNLCRVLLQGVLHESCFGMTETHECGFKKHVTRYAVSYTPPGASSHSLLSGILYDLCWKIFNVHEVG